MDIDKKPRNWDWFNIAYFIIILSSPIVVSGFHLPVAIITTIEIVIGVTLVLGTPCLLINQIIKTVKSYEYNEDMIVAGVPIIKKLSMVRSFFDPFTRPNKAYALSEIAKMKAVKSNVGDK